MSVVIIQHLDCFSWHGIQKSILMQAKVLHLFFISASPCGPEQCLLFIFIFLLVDTCMILFKQISTFLNLN